MVAVAVSFESSVVPFLDGEKRLTGELRRLSLFRYHKVGVVRRNLRLSFSFPDEIPFRCTVLV